MLVIVQRCYQIVMLMMLVDLLLKWLLPSEGQSNLARQLIDDFGIHPWIVVLTRSSLSFDHAFILINIWVRLRCIVWVRWNAMLFDSHFLLFMIFAPSYWALHHWSEGITCWRLVDLVGSYGWFIHQWVILDLLLVIATAHKYLCALIPVRLHILLVRCFISKCRWTFLGYFWTLLSSFESLKCNLFWRWLTL